MRPPAMLRPPRRSGRRLAVLGQILGVAVLAGCGPSSATQTPSGGGSTTGATSAIVARSGLRYAITRTERGDQACSTEHYSLVGAKVRNFPQTTRFCGPVGQATPPRLIQVARPAATLIVDRPARCGPVAIGRGRARAVVARSKCSVAAPHLRLTLVPAGRLLTVTGIPGVRQLDLTKSRCGFICTRTLAPQTGG